MTRLAPVILIVEDEFLLRLDSAETIESAGFEVIQAANADEAIAILKARPDIHVVFTDIQMPGSMDGLKLARFVRDRWPPIKIVATSGHVTVDEDDLPDGSVFLPKPYRGAHIVATLREWHRRRVGRHELASLDKRTLRDIGLDPGVVDYEVRQSFWRSPRDWRD